ncbi:MAG: 30S ribosomal protein S6 [Oscillospiraceae bacterium]|jgi:small subunit ribosomal protein S6|nr:30S ribosomal protein S6 [Oscillospiraceae bacterium]
MAKKNYEIMLVFSVKDGEDAAKELFEKFKALVEKHDGVINDVDEWGKRKLAYEINDEAEGYYVVVKYAAEPTFPVEMERVLRITDGVLRFLNIAEED